MQVTCKVQLNSCNPKVDKLHDFTEGYQLPQTLKQWMVLLASVYSVKLIQEIKV